MKITKYNLDNHITSNYVEKHLKCGDTISDMILKTFKLDQGNFYTFLPDTANIKEIYEFKRGGILFSPRQDNFSSENSNFSVTSAMDNILSDYIHKYILQNPDSMAVFEHVIVRRTEQLDLISGANLVYFKNEVYYLIDDHSSKNSTKEVIQITGQIWHFLCALTKKICVDENLSDYQLKTIAEHIKIFIVGAYDGEGYIIWEKR